MTQFGKNFATICGGPGDIVHAGFNHEKVIQGELAAAMQAAVHSCPRRQMRVRWSDLWGEYATYAKGIIVFGKGDVVCQGPPTPLRIRVRHRALLAKFLPKRLHADAGSRPAPSLTPTKNAWRVIDNQQ